MPDDGRVPVLVPHPLQLSHELRDRRGHLMKIPILRQMLRLGAQPAAMPAGARAECPVMAVPSTGGVQEQQ
jgi:hypothetical protein